ncbi:hypothetical protein [Ferribacterium limneticum]|uniref:hypothetical protein n=1 Tax=Ferribacterium limneticum TaxID=76259 RepID=UPI001CFB71AB|nr:hypothetical protein [Ferribacterium limneticum]UCV17793.1 hypothetical protein KI610_13315 [Ferribacterium limneticum]
MEKVNQRLFVIGDYQHEQNNLLIVFGKVSKLPFGKGFAATTSEYQTLKPSSGKLLRKAGIEAF